jgi:hypothetical protein
MPARGLFLKKIRPCRTPCIRLARAREFWSRSGTIGPHGKVKTSIPCRNRDKLLLEIHNGSSTIIFRAARALPGAGMPAALITAMVTAKPARGHCRCFRVGHSSAASLMATPMRRLPRALAPGRIPLKIPCKQGAAGSGPLHRGPQSKTSHLVAGQQHAERRIVLQIPEQRIGAKTERPHRPL